METKLQRQKDQWLPGARAREGRFTGHEETVGGKGIALQFDCSGGHITIHTCQNSLNCIPQIIAFYYACIIP